MMDDRAFGDTPLSRVNYYRRVCDLPAVIDPPCMGRIIMRATHVWGIVMPAPLGAAVRNHMRQQLSNVGPIMSHPRSKRWTILTRPDLPDEVPLFAELFRLNVSIVRTGGTIALPSPDHRSAHVRLWVEAPSCPFRPSGRVVVDAIRACAGPGRPPRAAAHV
ncbi:DNA-directed RNA polymerase subunit beta [Nocardia gipuzkoensis]|uniref:DNA-directed RNA polymerase subunit beta n=1 Tax=Nocardia gipuzkoensis TaxID=2749991 RepID=UPI003EDEBBD3